MVQSSNRTVVWASREVRTCRCLPRLARPFLVESLEVAYDVSTECGRLLYLRYRCTKLPLQGYGGFDAAGNGFVKIVPTPYQ